MAFAPVSPSISLFDDDLRSDCVVAEKQTTDRDGDDDNGTK